MEPNILYTKILNLIITWEVVHFIPKGTDWSLERLSHFPKDAEAINCRSWGLNPGYQRLASMPRVTSSCYCLCPETHLCALHWVVTTDVLVKASIKPAVMRRTLQQCNRERKRASMLSWRCKEKALLSVLEYFPSMYFIRNIIVCFKVKYVWMELFLSNLQGNFLRI